LLAGIEGNGNGKRCPRSGAVAAFRRSIPLSVGLRLLLAQDQSESCLRSFQKRFGLRGFGLSPPHPPICFSLLASAFSSSEPSAPCILSGLANGKTKTERPTNPPTSFFLEICFLAFWVCLGELKPTAAAVGVTKSPCPFFGQKNHVSIQQLLLWY
jgi:hypothetical protein